jgi:flagellar basal-body rod modification protein FlgD
MSVSAVSNDDGRAGLVAALNKGNTASATTTASASQEMSDRFLKLLVTQLKNQDPMNPMENAELTSQLAQMSTVEGISKLNTTLAEMSRTSQMVQGASLVGRSVLAEGDNLELTASGAVGGINLDSMADSVKVTVTDASGNTVRVLDLGKQDGGLVRFVWDGKDTAGTLLQNGSYSFKATATADGLPVTASTYGLGSVLSVSLNDLNGMDVEVSGLGVLTLDKIKQVY